MKALKRAIAIMAAAMALVIATAAPALAAEYKITINDPVDTHSYEAYQIFSGDPALGVLSNVEWGAGVNSEALLAFLKSDSSFGVGDANLFKSCTDADDVADVLEKSINTIALTDAFAAAVAEGHATVSGVDRPVLNTGIPSASPTGSDALGWSYTITVPNGGYYLIKAGDGVYNGHDAKTKYMIEVVENVTVTPKSSVPTLSKQVSISELSGYVEGVNAAFSNTVYFKLKGTMPTHIDDYGSYYYQLVDELPASLSNVTVNSVKVVNGSVENNVRSEDYVVSLTGNTLTVTIDDVKSAIFEATGKIANVSDEIHVVYSAKFGGEHAVVGETGNHNSAKLVYSNNPNGTNSDRGTTSVDKASVYSYQLVVTKYAEDGTTPLKGAKFKIHRSIDDTTWYAIVDANGKITDATTDAASATELITGSDGKIKITGVTAGNYLLTETSAPAGYDKLKEPIGIQISASINGSTGGLSNLTATVYSNMAVASVTSATKSTGVVEMSVVNAKGQALPETGGVGTTVFYVIGAVLVIGAAAALIVRKRGSERR